MEHLWKLINYLKNNHKDKKIKNKVARLEMATLAIEEKSSKRTKNYLTPATFSNQNSGKKLWHINKLIMNLYLQYARFFQTSLFLN